MIYEKIKIYVTNRVARILEKDAETFEFMKKDGITPNKNAFLASLITNYWIQYREQQSNLNDMIKNILIEETTLNDNKVTDLSTKILSKLNKENTTDNIEKFDSIISFKPTASTQPIIDYIDEYLLSGFTLSEYFRNMFTAYASLPQDMREKIIFKNQYTALSDAIKKHCKVFITTKSNNSLELAPYAFSHSKEEIHLYLLYKQGNCKSIKLSKLKSVVILEKQAIFSESDEKLFARMIEYGPQFFYLPNEQDVVIKLTPRGRQLYHKMYIHRPIPDEINGDSMVFRCSYTQIIQYFLRFGSDVEVVSPVEIKQALFNFHNSFVKKCSTD